MTSDLQVNDLATFRLTLDEASMRAFAELSGDTNPIHVDGDSARRSGFPRRIAYAGLLLAEVSRIIGTRIPGPGSLCVSYQFDFKAPVLVGESVLFEVTVTHYSEAARVALLGFVVRREHDQEVAMEGSATVRIPVDGGRRDHVAADA